MAAITVAMSPACLRDDQFAQLRHRFSQINFVLPSSDDEYEEIIGDVNVLVGRVPHRLLAQATQLQWIQNTGAGVDRLLTPDVISSDVIVTNARTLHAIQISEHVLAMMFVFARDLVNVMQAQRDHRWRPPALSPFCLEQQTLGVVGVGGIGSALARKAHHLGMRVVGLRRRMQDCPPYIDSLVGPEGLHELLRQSDHVALCCPLTPETKGMIGEAELDAMKASAYIYNIGRGRIIQAAPLLRALKEGSIAGAGLDVTDPEPLPPDSELWDMPNVLVTQHTSGTAPHNDEYMFDLLARNLQRFIDGEPLINVVDKQAGY